MEVSWRSLVPLGPPPDSNFLEASAKQETWPAGQRIYRAHSHIFGSSEFDGRNSTNARFSPLQYGNGIIPILYGGQDAAAAASETIFHTIDLPTSSTRPRLVFIDKYRSWQWSFIQPIRDLLLVCLDDDGLSRIGTDRRDLIEGGRPTYPATQLWASAIASAVNDADGIWWFSRQAPDRWAIILFESIRGRAGGLARSELVGSGPALPFTSNLGLSQLDEIAESMDITVVRP